jgi:hypothetical protein
MHVSKIHLIHPVVEAVVEKKILEVIKKMKILIPVPVQKFLVEVNPGENNLL